MYGQAARLMVPGSTRLEQSIHRGEVALRERGSRLRKRFPT
jgi:hypothetical protein